MLIAFTTSMLRPFIINEEQDSSMAGDNGESHETEVRLELKTSEDGGEKQSFACSFTQ